MSSHYERELCKKLRGDGFYAERGPGSLRRDILAWWPVTTYLGFQCYRIRIGEIKKTQNEDTFYLSRDRIKDQLRDLQQYAAEGYEAFWGVRFVRGPLHGRWRFWDAELIDAEEAAPLRRENGMTYNEYWYEEITNGNGQLG